MMLVNRFYLILCCDGVSVCFMCDILCGLWCQLLFWCCDAVSEYIIIQFDVDMLIVVACICYGYAVYDVSWYVYDVALLVNTLLFNGMLVFCQCLLLFVIVMLFMMLGVMFMMICC